MNEETIELEAVASQSEDVLSKEKKNIPIFDKTIKWCIYILIALLPLWFLPFTGNVLELNKQVLIVGLLTVALIAWLGKLLTQEKIEWHRGMVVFLFFVFVVVYGLATIFSVRPYDSLMGFDTHLSRSLINVVYFFIFFLLLRNHNKREGDIKKLLTIFLVSSGVVGIFGLLQILGKFILPWDFAQTNSFNTVGTVTTLGILFAAILPLVLSLLFRSKQEEEQDSTQRMRFRVFLAGLAILSLVIILLLNFRVLWIVTSVGMIMIIIFWLNKRRSPSSKNLGWLAIPVVIFAFCLIFLLFKPGLAFDLNLPIELGLSYKGGINLVKEIIQRSPILGTGPETFIYNYSLYKPASINQTIFWNLRFTNAPSGAFSMAAEAGILGLAAFLAIIAVFLVQVIKNFISSEKKPDQPDKLIELKLGLFSGWLVLLVAWFLYPQNTTLMFVFWLFFAFLIIAISKKENTKIINIKTSGKTALVVSFGFIILVMFIVGLLYLEGTKFFAEVQYKSGINLINKDELDLGVNKIVRATVINPYEDKFYRNLSQFFLAQINQNLNNAALDQAERANRVQVGISNTINSAVRATVLNSRDVLNWTNRGLIYRSLMNLVSGAGDWAVTSYEEALKFEPGNPFIYTEIAKTYLRKVDMTDDQAGKIDYLSRAVGAYNSAIQLKPNYALPHFELALLFERLGQTGEAITRMENSRALVPRDAGVAFQLAVLYYKTSQFDKAKAEFIRAIGLEPDFSNARYFLGLLFDREGEKAEAIEQFEKIAESNPDNESVRQILANLRAGRPALGSSDLGPPTQPEEIPL